MATAPPATVPPPGNNGKGKWILGGLAVVLAIALAVVITALVVRPESDKNGGAAANSELASANDTGPANIITDDPTCEAWSGIARTLSTSEQSVGWADRDEQIPATAWTPEQRTMYESVAKAMAGAAALTTNLVKQTPHRVVRELYGQFSVYANAFADRAPSYVAKDVELAAVTDGLSSAMTGICSAIAYHSAARVGPLVTPPQPPSARPVSATDTPERFLSGANPTCSKWETSAKKYAEETASWRAIDPNTPRSEMTAQQISVTDAVAPIMSTSADNLERLGRESANATFEDFAVLAAQYRRAYVIALPNYVQSDNFLSSTSTYLVNSVLWACKAES